VLEDNTTLTIRSGQRWLSFDPHPDNPDDNIPVAARVDYDEFVDSIRSGRLYPVTLYLAPQDGFERECGDNEYCLEAINTLNTWGERNAELIGCLMTSSACGSGHTAVASDVIFSPDYRG